jgi:penicillin G amidase
MAVSDGPRADGVAPGLGQLGKRLLVGALLMIALLLVLGRWGEDDRKDREAFASVSGTIRISELAAPVEILRDARGIAHVSAERGSEGWFGLGFAHGQDRLAQMLRMRRRAQGRSAEVDGRGALPVDRLARVLEISRTSNEVVAELPESSRTVLESYSAGVNARIARVRQGRVEPPRWLDEPTSTLENWKPADSVAVGKLLSWCMGGTLETTLVLDEMIQRLDSVPARPFFPGGSSVDFGVAPDLPSPARDAPASKPLHEISEEQLTRRLCAGIGIPTGSAWIIDGRASQSGAPILVADWHLAPAVPALFYEAEVTAGKIEVAGVTIPGSPIFWAGRNRSLAWAGVPASAPVADLFIETLHEDRNEYQNGTVWAQLEAREEVLRFREARGEIQEIPLRIRSTRHGPLIEALFEVSEDPAAKPEPTGPQHSSRALSWTGARSGDGLTSMLALMRANSAEGLVAALVDHHEPVLAIAYADRQGAGGVQVAGWLPKRPLPTGLVPVQGRLRSFDWRQRITQEELPAIAFDESVRRGWVIAADQAWPTQGGLDQMEWLWRSGERASRIETALEGLRRVGKIDLRGAAELVNDDLAQRAPRVVAAILSMARRQGPLPQEADEVALLLERWDGAMSAESGAAAAYHLVIEHLLESLLREPFGNTLFEHYLAAPHIRPQYAIESLLLRSARLRRSGGWTDEERVSAAARESLRGAWVSLNHRLGPTRDRWAWGALHQLKFSPTGRAPQLSGNLSREVSQSGDGQTLSFARHRPGISFDVESAGVYRVAMDLDSSDHLLSALAPGQSEHPGHPHFADGLGRWSSTRLPLFATNRLVIEQENSNRLILEPAP